MGVVIFIKIATVIHVQMVNVARIMSVFLIWSVSATPIVLSKAYVIMASVKLGAIQMNNVRNIKYACMVSAITDVDRIMIA